MCLSAHVIEISIDWPLTKQCTDSLVLQHLEGDLMRVWSLVGPRNSTAEDPSPAASSIILTAYGSILRAGILLLLCERLRGMKQVILCYKLGIRRRWIGKARHICFVAHLQDIAGTINCSGRPSASCSAPSSGLQSDWCLPSEDALVHRAVLAVLGFEAPCLRGKRL